MYIPSPVRRTKDNLVCLPPPFHRLQALNSGPQACSTSILLCVILPTRDQASILKLRDCGVHSIPKREGNLHLCFH